MDKELQKRVENAPPSEQLTKREEFAKTAMGALLGNNQIMESLVRDGRSVNKSLEDQNVALRTTLSQISFSIADAMLEVSKESRKSENV